jgi:hypothetical protein
MSKKKPNQWLEANASVLRFAPHSSAAQPQRYLNFNP